MTKKELIEKIESEIDYFKKVEKRDDYEKMYYKGMLEATNYDLRYIKELEE